MVELCVRLFLAHHEDLAGCCAGCGVPIGAWVRRRRARLVLAATGLDLISMVAAGEEVDAVVSVGG